jgi:hypothetical protein
MRGSVKTEKSGVKRYTRPDAAPGSLIVKKSMIRRRMKISGTRMVVVHSIPFVTPDETIAPQKMAARMKKRIRRYDPVKPEKGSKVPVAEKTRYPHVHPVITR